MESGPPERATPRLTAATQTVLLVGLNSFVSVLPILAVPRGSWTPRSIDANSTLLIACIHQQIRVRARFLESNTSIQPWIVLLLLSHTTGTMGTCTSDAENMQSGLEVCVEPPEYFLVPF